jgi:hypothetical protein
MIRSRLQNQVSHGELHRGHSTANDQVSAVLYELPPVVPSVNGFSDGGIIAPVLRSIARRVNSAGI